MLRNYIIYISSLLTIAIVIPFILQQASEPQTYKQNTREVAGIDTSTGTAQPVGQNGSWKLVFSDEFNGTNLDPQVWSKSWFNGGKMNNVTTNPANVSVGGGNLILTLTSNTEGALVNTNPSDGGKSGFAIGYGYLEAKVFFPGNGQSIYNWPAWWTDGQNWPQNGEIDIAEGLGTLTSNYHSSSGANNSNTVAGNWANAYHVYAVNRQPGKNDIYWDGKLIRSYATNDGGSPHYLIFNIGSGNQQVLGVGSQVKVDYVRVWEKCTTNCPSQQANPTQPPPSIVTPTLYCLGACSTTPTVTMTPVISPTSAVGSPVPTTNSGNPSPTTDPCIAESQSGAVKENNKDKDKKDKENNGNGFFAQLIKRIMQFLEAMFGWFRDQPPQNPVITPVPTIAPTPC